jgi:spore coat protein U-like protein
MKKFLLLTAIACTASLSAVAPAMADVTPEGTINVSTNVAKSCTTPTATAATVTGYDGTANKSADSAIGFKCTKNTVGTVNLKSASTSANNGGTLSAPGKTDTLTYSLTGDGTTKTGTGLSGTGTTNVLNTTATVNVAAGQDVEPAEYKDTVAVTISY